MNYLESIKKYTSGEITLEEVNAALAGSGYHLDPGQNTLTEEPFDAEKPEIIR